MGARWWNMDWWIGGVIWWRGRHGGMEGKTYVGWLRRDETGWDGDLDMLGVM